jgi:hypothetical protein
LLGEFADVVTNSRDAGFQINRGRGSGHGASSLVQCEMTCRSIASGAGRLRGEFPAAAAVFRLEERAEVSEAGCRAVTARAPACSLSDKRAAPSLSSRLARPAMRLDAVGLLEDRRVLDLGLLQRHER